MEPPLTYPQVFKRTPVIYGAHSPQLAAYLIACRWLVVKDKTCIILKGNVFALEKSQYQI